MFCLELENLFRPSISKKMLGVIVNGSINSDHELWEKCRNVAVTDLSTIMVQGYKL